MTRVLATFGLVAALWISPLAAQQPCSFVLGFAEFAARSGDLVGVCVDEQRTVTLSEDVIVPGYGRMILQPGETVQMTTHGLLRWNEQNATVEFLSREGRWRIGDGGLILTRWEASAPQPDVSIPAPLQPAWETLTSSTAMVPYGPEKIALGALMRTTAEVTGVKLQVGPLTEGTVGQYRAADNSLTVNVAFLGEDSRALAAVLAHEFTHARQVHAGAGGNLDCVPMEVEAYVMEALVWSSFWIEQAPPTRTVLERHLTNLLEIAVKEGTPGFYKMVVDAPGYQDQCRLWVPEAAPRSSDVPPASVGPPSRLTDALRSRCVNVVSNAMRGVPITEASSRTQAAFLERCLSLAKTDGEPGVTCLEATLREARAAVLRGERPGGEAMSARERDCLERIRR